MPTRCVCPGSFDPVTNGHVDVIRRAAGLFDEVIVTILHNPAKAGTFTPEERRDLILEALPADSGIRVEVFAQTLLVDVCRSLEATAVVKGLRGGTDFAYELPMVLAVASVALAAGTLSLSGIVEQWQPWWLLWQLPGAIVFFIAALAEINRTPFDMPIADSEIVFGAFTEYTGLRFAFFLLAEYAGIVVMALLFTVLYLGGWAGPLAASLGVVWTLLKAWIIAAIIVWMRVSWPRLREDQLHRLAWVWLIPIALFQLALTAVVVVMTR